MIQGRLVALALDLVPAACTATVALLLVWIAPRMNWVDASEGPDASRKLQRLPIACAGGAAILVGLLVSAFIHRFELMVGPTDWISTGAQLWPAGGLTAAFVVGLADDVLPRGLSAGRKLAGQALAGVALAAPMIANGVHDAALGRYGVSIAVVVLAAIVAQNAVNTFDNADGAAASLCALGLVFSPCICAGAVLGLLPFNLPRRDRPARLFLGDAGSHLLGLLILLHPAAWGVFVLMLFDLLRVCVQRVRDGQPIWIGDRRHLAHRLERKGLSGLAIVLRLLVIAAPAVIGWGYAQPFIDAAPRGIGLGWYAAQPTDLPVAWAANPAFAAAVSAIAGAVVTLVLFALAVAWSRPRAALVSGSGSPPQPAGVHRAQ